MRAKPFSENKAIGTVLLSKSRSVSVKYTYVVILCILSLYAYFLIKNMEVTDIDGCPTAILFDDMMISLRYAHQLVSGNGLVWNPGERVEGFTNPLWTLIFAMVIWCSSQAAAPGIIQVLGAGTLLAAIALVLRAVLDVAKAERAEVQIAAISISAAVFLLWYPAFYWSIEGCEVSACLLVAALSMTTYFRWADGDLNDFPALNRLGYFGAVGWLVRPDTPILVIPFFAAVSLGIFVRTGRLAITCIARALVVPIGVFIAYTAFRLSYYGQFFPNTLAIYQFRRHSQSFGRGKHRIMSLMAFRMPLVNQESFPRASFLG